MGTRSLTHFYDNNDEILVTLYRQYDGYPDGHGCDLAAYLAGTVVVNGIPYGEKGRLFNGPGDLAVRTIAALRNAQGDKPGNLYIVKPGTTDAWEEFTYEVHAPLDEEPRIVCCEEDVNLSATDFLARFRPMPRE